MLWHSFFPLCLVYVCTCFACACFEFHFFFSLDVTESMTSALLACSVNSIPECLAKKHHSMHAEQLQVSLGSQRKYKIN